MHKCTRIRNEFGPRPIQFYFDFELNVNKSNSLALDLIVFEPGAGWLSPFRGRKCGHHLNAKQSDSGGTTQSRNVTSIKYKIA